MQVMVNQGELLCYDAATGVYYKSTLSNINRNINNINRILMEGYDPMGPKYSPDDILKWISEGFGLGTRTVFHVRIPGKYIPWYRVDCDMYACVTDDDRPCLVTNWILYYK